MPDDIFAQPPRSRYTPMVQASLPADLPAVASPVLPWATGRTITCRVHLLPCPANDRAALLCPECMADLDKAQRFMIELRDTAETALANALARFDALVAQSDDKVRAWWATMDEHCYFDPPRYKALCAKALAIDGRGAVIVRARMATDDAALALEAINERCRIAMNEITTAKETNPC